MGCMEDPTELPQIRSVTVDPPEAQAGTTVLIEVEVDNFELAEHGEEHTEGNHGVRDGHVHVYLDSLLDEPLAMPSTNVFQIAIPGSTTSGSHQLIMRLHSADHLIIEPQTISAATITVE